MSIDTAIAVIRSAASSGAVKPQAPPASFFTVAAEGAEIRALEANITKQLAPLYATVEPISAAATFEHEACRSFRSLIEPLTGDTAERRRGAAMGSQSGGPLRYGKAEPGEAVHELVGERPLSASTMVQ